MATGAALIGYVLWQTILVWGYFVLSAKEKSDRMVLPPLFCDNSTVFNESDSFLNMEKHRYLVLGISYLTFKSVQMIMEIRDGMIKTYKPFRYIQFLLFFPTISSGPIDRYRRFEKISSIRLFVINMLIFWEKASKIFCRFYINSLSVIILVKYCFL